MSPPEAAPLAESDAPRWHKRFSGHCNNRGRDLSVQPARTPAEDREMLNIAHAAAWHGGQIGTELQRMRAQMLLAEAHALLAFGTSALAMAEAMRSYFIPRDCEPWELTLTHAIHAHAGARGRSGPAASAVARRRAGCIRDDHRRGGPRGRRADAALHSAAVAPQLVLRSM